MGLLDSLMTATPTNDFLERLDGTLDWKPIERALQAMYPATTGRPPCAPLTLFEMSLRLLFRMSTYLEPKRMKKTLLSKKILLSLPCLLVAGHFSSAQTAFHNTNLAVREEMIIKAADAGAAPQFNGAHIVGVHPNTPLTYSLAVSGKRPLEFSAKKLPAGLTLDATTGIITGTLPEKGEFTFTASAKNSSGKATAKIKIICGDTLALTPPMGWNSYDAFGDNVVESEVLANARYIAEKMQPAGWDTVVVDYCWSDPGAHDNHRNARASAPLAADKFGRLLPAPNRFPSAVDGPGFKPLADAVHALGLKFGIHIMRGIPRNSVNANLPIEDSNFTAADAANTNDKCVWCPDMFGVNSNAAGQAWYDSCARLWAAWDVDYIKVDDLSYPYQTAEVEMVRRAIDRCGCSIVFSTSPGETPVADAAHVMTHANLWRVSDDFWDNWKSLDHEFSLAVRWHDFVGPGHWPDADILPVGHLSVGHRSVGGDRFTHLTHDEQLTLLSLWSLLPSPLMVGANLPDNDAWTLALLTNPEVIAVNQDALGQPAQRLTNVIAGAEIWTKKLADKSLAVGIFNRSETAVSVNLVWHDLGLGVKPVVRDLWLRKDLDRAKNFDANIPPHGCCLLSLPILGLWLTSTGILNASHIPEDDVAWKMLTDRREGLRQGTRLAFNCPEAEHNTQILQTALALVADGETLVIPPGYYDLECIKVFHRTNLTICGFGVGKTVLRRKGFEWDCDIQGTCTQHTELFQLFDSTGITLRDLTLDGNSHHLAIKGHGTFDDKTGAILSGLPQFPSFEGGSGHVFKAGFCNHLSISNCVFENGFRWAVAIFQANDLLFERNIIDTGNLSTLFKGHLDQGGNVRHAHTSQDGLHLVNCRSARILHNTIHSEDSGIAVEASPPADWPGGFLVQDIEIAGNDVSSGMPVDPSKRLCDRDRIYGTGLIEHYTGCGAIDIFYNEGWDLKNVQNLCAVSGIRIHGNHLHHSRMGVRVNNYTSVGPYGLDSLRHQMRDVSIYDNNPAFTSGQADHSVAGIDHIDMDENPDVFNPNGGVGICVRNTDELFIRGNTLSEIHGGIGIELRKCIEFSIQSNWIDQITGTSLALNEAWPGGNGIRVENDPAVLHDPVFVSGVFNARNWSISENRIGSTAAAKIFIRSTTGHRNIQGNTDLNDLPLKPEDLILTNCGDLVPPGNSK